MALEKRPSFEEKKRAIDAHIARAKLTASPREEIDRLKSEGDRLAIAWREGKLSEQEYDDGIAAILDAPNVVKFDTLAEFAYALRKLLPEAQAREVLAHENDHMGRIEHHNLRGHYAIGFARDSDGQLSLTPSVRYEPLRTMSIEELDAIDEDITGAPNELSDADKADLESIRHRNLDNQP